MDWCSWASIDRLHRVLSFLGEYREDHLQQTKCGSEWAAIAGCRDVLLVCILGQLERSNDAAEFAEVVDVDRGGFYRR